MSKYERVPINPLTYLPGTFYTEAAERILARRASKAAAGPEDDREPRSVEDVLDDETRDQLDQAREVVEAEHDAKDDEP